MNEQQPSLFEATPSPLPVRATDPETSRSAARSVNLKVRKAEVMGAAFTLAAPFTASEVHRLVRRAGGRQEPGSVRSRLSQLAGDGLVAKTGGVRTCPVDQGGTGRPEQLWRLTPEGVSWCYRTVAA